MKASKLVERGLALLEKKHRVRKPLLLDMIEAEDPLTGKKVCEVVAASSAHPNGPTQRIVLDADGEPLEHTPHLAALLDRSPHVDHPAHVDPALLAASVTISPDTNVLTLNPGDTFNETITVTIPKNAGVTKADIYFLADTTGSMDGILNAVQTGANNILTALSGLGLDLAFGVGNYKDFPHDAYAFQHQQNPTNVAAAVTAAINAWSAAGGVDIPEGQLFALDRLSQPPGGSIGWRTGAKRIIVWFGDAPGHDPICPAISGAAVAITEATVKAKLIAENIKILAISTATPGLDDDPKPAATDYVACGPPGGAPGQGSRLSSATGGFFVTGINPTTIVNTIIGMVTAAVSSITNVKLIPSATIAPFVTSITPAAGFGPLSGDKEHVLKFEVTFTGTAPCSDKPQVFLGTLDVVADGAVVAAKKVQITVPSCRPKFHVYSVKFVCGTQSDCACECAPVRPGQYSTEINIHNYSEREVVIRKRFIPVVFAGAPIGREPRVATSKAEDSIKLPPHSATMDDCCRIAELLFGGVVPSPQPLTIGFVEITASAEVAVTAVYTASAGQQSGVSLDIETIVGHAQ